MAREKVELRLTTHQCLRLERLATALRPGETLAVGESRRLLLEYALLREDENNLVPVLR